MEWYDAEYMMEYWAIHPPEHLLIHRAWFKPKDDSDRSEMESPSPRRIEQDQRATELMVSQMGAPTRDASTLPPGLWDGLNESLKLAQSMKDGTLTPKK